MWTQRRANKYGAKRTVFNNRKYMSKGEAGYAQDLELMKKAGLIREIVPQYRLRLDVNGYHICDYLVDFKVTLRDGSEELHEYKGMKTYEWLLKWRLTEAIWGKKYKLVLIQA